MAIRRTSYLASFSSRGFMVHRYVRLLLAELAELEDADKVHSVLL